MGIELVLKKLFEKLQLNKGKRAPKVLTVKKVLESSPTHLFVEWQNEGFWLPRREVAVWKTGEGWRLQVPRERYLKMQKVLNRKK
ncbi:MAG: hypothetical protein Kow0037_20460 [Calditrichia bacterium]